MLSGKRLQGRIVRRETIVGGAPTPLSDRLRVVIPDDPEPDPAQGATLEVYRDGAAITRLEVHCGCGRHTVIHCESDRDFAA